MEIINVQRDRRINCTSVLTTMTAGEYLKMVDGLYQRKGGIEGQRPALKSKTAVTIRHRMIEDLIAGAVIPPLVLGIHTRNDALAIMKHEHREAFEANIRSIDPDSISIIDGMQRTNALAEAIKENPEIRDYPLRVEFWISGELNALIYRMLVLNTGQIPWEIGRQLETVYSQLILLLRESIGDAVEIYTKNDNQRRSEPGQFQASTVVRLYLAFTARRTEFDIRDKVAEDFARLDAIESSSHRSTTDLFVRTFRMLVALDKGFSRATDQPKSRQIRISDGREIFQSEPALLGFFVAVSISLFDLPGFEPDWQAAEGKMQAIEAKLGNFEARLDRLSSEQIDAFLELDVLNQRLDQRSGQVGRFERDLFLRAFQRLIAEADRLESMRPCWLA